MTYPLNIAKGLGQAFATLESTLADVSNFTVLLRRLGWRVELTDEQMSIVNSIMSVSGALGDLGDSLAELETDDGDPNVAVVVEAALAVSAALYQLADADLSNITSLPAPLSDEAFWREIFAPALINLLLIDFIQDQASALHGFMDAFGLIEAGTTEGGLWWATTPTKLRWDRLLPAVTDPIGHLKSMYGWNGDLQTAAIVDTVRHFAQRLGLQAYQVPISDVVRARFYPELSTSAVIKATEIVLIDNGITRAGLRVLPIHTAQDQGLYIEPFVIGNVAAAISPISGIEFAVAASAETNGSGIFFQPIGPQETIGLSTTLDHALSLLWQPDAPQVLLGKPGGARLEIVDGEITIAFRGSAADPEFVITVGGRDAGLQLVLSPEDSDSFVNELLHNITLNTNLSARLVWSSKTGFAIEGGAGLEIIVPLNIDFQVITIHELYAALALAAEHIEITGAISFSAQIPPLTFTVNRIGLITTITPSADPTTNGLSGLEVALAFKPPSGAGIELDLIGIVKGGGYLEHDPDKGEYSGIVTVELLSLGITAIGIVTTKPPDNPGGWSMFVSINVDLGGIPLGFGFTLEKVGGLVGVHRSINTTAFQEGVRTGLLDSVLFPDDPIANAARILSDIETAFPTAQGSFVFGAMLQIGWGVPTLITGDLGFIIQVPDIIIALIGQVESVLPDDVVPLIEIHFDVVGVIDIAEGTLAIDAGIRDSRLLAYVLTGQMAMRASFIDNPSFLLAVGGFHPAFSPPCGFPTLDRVGFGIGVGDWLSITLETYLALTSNTLQFGAGLYLTASFVGFEIEGGTDINTLITFSPFSFRADLRFYITVSAGPVELLGVLLTGQISGPNPIFVRGVARFKILGIEEEVSIEESIGGSSPIDEIDEVDVRSDVVEAFEDIQSWRAVDEGARIGAVLLAEVTPVDSEVLVHPGGLAEVVQRVAPLDVELEHFGNAAVEGEDSLDITDVEAGGTSFAWEFSEDWFAPAQFFDFADDEKLGAPSFEKMNAGIRFGDDSAESGTSIDTIYDYEQIIVDPEFLKRSTKLRRAYIPQQEQVSLFASQKGTTQKPLTSAKPVQKVTLKSTQYVIVERSTLTTQSGVPRRKMTFAEASQATKGMSAAQIVVTSAERKAK